jgi:hypothetical protein
MMDEEQTVAVVLSLYGCQSRTIRSPEGLLPGVFEEIAFRDIRACSSDDLAEFVHRLANFAGVLASRRNIRLTAGDVRESRWSAARDDRQGERIQNGGICGGIPGRGYFFGRCSGQSLVEMQRYSPVAAGCEQSISQTRLLIRFQQ